MAANPIIVPWEVAKRVDSKEFTRTRLFGDTYIVDERSHIDTVARGTLRDGRGILLFGQVRRKSIPDSVPHPFPCTDIKQMKKFKATPGQPGGNHVLTCADMTCRIRLEGKLDCRGQAHFSFMDRNCPPCVQLCNEGRV